MQSSSQTLKQPKSMRTRVLVVLGAFMLMFVALVCRLGFLMIVRADYLRDEGEKQWTRTFTVEPKRGVIMDITGKVLAQSASSYNVELNPTQVKVGSETDVALTVSQHLGLESQEVLDKALDKTKDNYTLARQLEPHQVESLRTAIQEAGIKGVQIVEGSRRYYPMGDFLTQVLGFCNISGQGQEGLEKALDAVLRGEKGSIKSEKDGRGRRLPNSTDTFIEPKNGQNVVLTIDSVVQGITERAARQALEETGAKRVLAIVMNVKTGDILAMVNVPDFDLNNPPRDDITLLTQLMRNGNVTDNYEPGSTFKMITTAAAIEEGKVTLNEGFNCRGSVIVDGDRIRCWRTGNPHGHQSLTEAVMNSCNPVFVELGLRMGRETFYDYVNGFGFGKTTGSELAGEASGIVMPMKYVKEVDLARIAFGQSVAVTPLQMITAGCAVVNGGNLMKPNIVHQILPSANDMTADAVITYEPQMVGKPISEETSAIMRDILEQVVESGGGRNAYVPGYRVGGKTGTAQKYVNGKIRTDAHVCSFMGFAPINDPEIAVLFISDEPTMRPDYGSITAAPYARQIFEETLKYMGIQPQFSEKDKQQANKTVTVPDVQGMAVAEASQELSGAELGHILDGSGEKVQEQLPPPGAQVPAGSIIMLYLEPTEGEATGLVEVPEIIGKSLIEANRTLNAAGLTMKINGTGIAESQSPEAGALVEAGSAVKVTFKQP